MVGWPGCYAVAAVQFLGGSTDYVVAAAVNKVDAVEDVIRFLGGFRSPRNSRVIEAK